tara:strand:- start:38 stop:196 length:159 start_codon:yes stop_codon:yes gene_type:complete
MNAQRASLKVPLIRLYQRAPPNKKQQKYNNNKTNLAQDASLLTDGTSRPGNA